MELLLNLSGSILLILAGVVVLIFWFRQPSVPTVAKKIDFHSWIVIALLALAVRWLIFLIHYGFSGSPLPFITYLREIFIKSGDSPHYLYLAENGYTATGDQAKLIVFYPLYPLLIRIFRFFLQDYVTAALWVSNLSYMAAACVFYELLRLDFDKKQAASGVALMVLAPFSMFYSAIFTESIFILTTVLCLYFMRTKKPFLMGIMGFLACLSRTQGVILFVCALIPTMQDLFRHKKCNKKEIIGALIISLGFFCYLLLNRILFGNWFQYLEFQAAEPWYNTAQWFGKTLSYSYSMAVQYPFLAKIIYLPQLVLFYVGVFAIFIGVFQKIRTEYLVYLGAYLFTCYTHGWLISGSRYMCACLPLFVVFASIKNKYIRYGILLLSGVLCFIYTGLFLKGEAIM